MEDLLILILQVLGEILFEMFAWWPWDYVWWWGPWDREDRTSPGFWAGLASLGMGAALGWLSLFVFPAVLVKWAWLRIVLLFVSPVASGVMAFHFAQRREKQFEYVDPPSISGSASAFPSASSGSASPSRIAPGRAHLLLKRYGLSASFSWDDCR